jgi:hypothetical protein
MAKPFPVLAVLVAALAGLVLHTGSAQACEKHLNGHQNSSESQSEGSNR